MIIKQISVFLENTAGRIADVTRILKEGGINLKALMIADTADLYFRHPWRCGAEDYRPLLLSGKSLCGRAALRKGKGACLSYKGGSSA